MQINSIVASKQYDIHKELNNKYENKRKERNNKQEISFCDVLEQIKNNNYKIDKSRAKK